MSQHQKMTYNNVVTSGQVCMSKGINRLCCDIIAVSQHQLNVLAQERQCCDIGINLQHCISMLQHHHDMELSQETRNCPKNFQCRDISYNPRQLTTPTSRHHHDITLTSTTRVANLGFLKCVILASFLGPKT